MNQIYVSGPWSFSSGVLQVVKSIKTKSKDKVVYSENISRGMLSELLWCINHRVPMFLAYKSANGLGIYGTEIDDNLNFKGVAGTVDNFYKILSGQFGNIVADDSIFLKGFRISDAANAYLKGEIFTADPLDFLNVEKPTSYFY